MGYVCVRVCVCVSVCRDVGQGHAGHAMACPVVGTLKLSGHQSLQEKKEKEGRRKKKEEKKCIQTRPDTRPIPVADGWAGAEMRVFPLFDSSVTDQPTDRRIDRRTDKASYRVACPRLKTK